MASQGVVISVFASLLFILSFASGQRKDLVTFDEIRATLERGATVVLDVDGSECQSNFPFPDTEHRYISLPFRDWAYWSDGAGEVYIRANDYYFQSASPIDPSMAITARQAVVRPDGSISFHFRSRVPNTGEEFQVDLECQIGVGARVFEYQANTVIDRFVNYQEVKSALLLGKHLEAVLFAEACGSTEGWIGAGGAVHYGHRIENFAVFNDGTPQEILVFHVTTLYADFDPQNPFRTWWTSIGYIMYPDGTVSVPIGIYSSGQWENQWTEPSASCTTGISLQFSSYRESDATYVTYADVKRATLEGHEVEVIIFTEFCDIVSGTAELPRAIVGHRFDQFQLNEAGDLWGPVESIAFNAFEIAPNGMVIIDEIKLSETGSITFDWFRWIGGTQQEYGTLTCPLQLSALFHSISRNRGPSYSYVEIMRAIKNEGAVFEIAIDYDSCDQGGSPAQLDAIQGAVLWETYIRENELGVDEDFLAPIFSAKSDYLTADGTTGLWSTGFIMVTRDNTATIWHRVYDWNANDVSQGNATDPITCKLNTGSLDGSVFFFRYP